MNRLADSLAYVGHPYGFSPDGNESSLQSITLAALAELSEQLRW